MLQCNSTLPRYILFASSKPSLKNIFITDVPVTTQNPIGMNTKSPRTEQLAMTTAFTTIAGGPSDDDSSSPVTTILVAVCVVLVVLLAITVFVIVLVVVCSRRKRHVESQSKVEEQEHGM